MAKQTIFASGIDLVGQLEEYQDSGHLTSSTRFIAFEGTDLYTVTPPNGELDALGRFLLKTAT